MSTKRVNIDWTHPPPDVERSLTPDSLHDGVLERLDFDVRARTVSMVVEVGYLCRFGGLPDDVRFGIEISAVTAMRAEESRHHPDPMGERAGESRSERDARIDAWRALGQTVSVGWDEAARTITAVGLEISTGAMLFTETGAAIRLAGYLYLDEPGTAAKWFTITVAGGAIRWTRSDGVPWSAEQLDELSEGYWDAFAGRTPRRGAP